MKKGFGFLLVLVACSSCLKKDVINFEDLNNEYNSKNKPNAIYVGETYIEDLGDGNKRYVLKGRVDFSHFGHAPAGITLDGFFNGSYKDIAKRKSLEGTMVMPFTIYHSNGVPGSVPVKLTLDLIGKDNSTDYSFEELSENFTFQPK